MKHSGNLYDFVCIDIEEAHRNFVRHKKRVFNKKSLYFTSRLVKFGLWKKLIDSGFIRDWFNEFNDYWINCLGCRPLKLHDFFWLHSHYRTKFQDIEVTEEVDAQEFMKAWQQYENIYLIFGAVYKYALSPLSFLPYRKYLKSSEHLLEYGCGVAPITYSALIYGNFKKCKFTIADIKTFTYHYAKWRLSHCSNVFFLDIDPDTDALPKLSYNYDLVFLITVLEHLPNPLQVVKHIYHHMETGAHLIFDYAKGVGKGLDTVQSIREREHVLEFIEGNFELINGKIDKYNSMGKTIVRKKE